MVLCSAECEDIETDPSVFQPGSVIYDSHFGCKRSQVQIKYYCQLLSLERWRKYMLYLLRNFYQPDVKTQQTDQSEFAPPANRMQAPSYWLGELF